jgi:8-oxo-dGTP diphosphatase
VLPQVGIMTQFGTKTQVVEYIARPGAYGITRDPEGRVALLEIKGKLFLPGGGIDPGERPEDALIRECKEEAGWEVEVGNCLGQANEYLFGPSENRHFDIQGTFYTFKILGEPGEGKVEAGLALVWLSPEEALPRMARQSQAAMIQLS